MEALLEDEMVPFAGFVQRLFDAQGYLGASTLVKIYVVNGYGSCICAESPGPDRERRPG
jgi:hypothetical protein